MSERKTNPRHIAGKHLTLTEDELLPFITRIPSDIVPPLSIWMGVCKEAYARIDAGELDEALRPQVDAIHKFLVEFLKNSVSVQGKGREELVQAIQALEEQQLHRDAGMPMERTGGLRP